MIERIDFNPGYHVFASVYSSMGVNRVKRIDVKEKSEKEMRVMPISKIPENYDPMTYFIGKYFNLLA